MEFRHVRSGGSERIMEPLDEVVHETTAFLNKGDVNADLKPVTDPVTEPQRGPVGFAIQGDLLVVAIVYREIAGCSKPQLGKEAALRRDASIFS